MPGEDPRIFSYVDDPWLREKARYYFWVDCLLLAVSMIGRIEEFLVQFKYGEIPLALVIISSWLPYFFPALVLWFHDLRQTNSAAEIDMVAGTLPACSIAGACSTAGATRKTILGIPKSWHQHILWKCAWGLSATVSVLTVLSSYLALSRPTAPLAFFVWRGFKSSGLPKVLRPLHVQR